ncbi:MAG: CarD family transcriptional regulator, partial [Paracoccaceae bacterium]
MSTNQHIHVGGAPEGFDAQLLLQEIQRSGAPVISIGRDDKHLAATRAALAFFAPGVRVLNFPAWDCLPYDRVSPNADISATRMATLSALVRAPVGPFIVLTTLNGVTQRIAAREILRDAAFSARVGERLDEAALHSFLARMGFSRAPTVLEAGDFAVRGGIIDIFAPGQSGPVRLDLFGDVLDGARRFDPATQRTIEKLSAVELAPVSEIVLDQAAITRFRQNYRAEFGAAGKDDPLYEAVSAGRKHQGVEHWLPFFHEKLETIFDFLPTATIVLDDAVDADRLARWQRIEDLYETRMLAMQAKNRMDTVYKPCPPGLLYLDDAAWSDVVKARRVLYFNALPQATGPGVTDAGGRIGRNFSPERQLESVSVFGALQDHINARRADGQVVIACYSPGARERLQGLLADQGLKDTTLIDDFRDIPTGAGGVWLVVWALEHGFEGRGLTVISEQDVLGDRLIRAPRKRRRAENFLSEAQSLSPDDLVVHVDHGLGRYRGLEVVIALGAAHECILLEYAGGDRLFLPVENIELLSRYGHEEGLLDRLGGGAWQAKKARLKANILEMADRLIRLAAERLLRSAPIMEPPPGIAEAFAARFPYQETDDQRRAIEEVLSDMAAGRPMERLVCGDVGFGKTEVAMRAAFVAAMSGAQVAIIAPTTLLARQHYNSFAERFRGFAVNVRQLSRFVSARDAASTRAGMAAGTVDIVIGTHALLARAIRFRNLGLLVVD